MTRFYNPAIALSLAALLLAACDSAAPPPPLPPSAGSATQQSATQQSSAQQPETPTSPPASSPVVPPSPQPTEVAPATAGSTSQLASEGTRIRVIMGSTVLTGRLWDNATARDLIAQLPLTLTFSDFNALEKIARLPRRLSTDGVPAGDDPSPRDIGYYAPSMDLVFYYGDIGYFNGIVRIGQFDGSVDAIASQSSDFTARVELAP